MTSRDFVFWFQGYLEINSKDNRAADRSMVSLTVEQVKCIQDHLNLVFKHEIDPSYGDEKVQKILNETHFPRKPKGGDGLIRC